MSAVVKITVMALKISPICLIYFDKLTTDISIRPLSLLDGSTKDKSFGRPNVSRPIGFRPKDAEP